MQERFLVPRWRGVLASGVLALLAACGGGGGGGDTPADTNPPAPQATDFTLSGVAAQGAALAGATVRVYDRSGGVVGNTVLTGTDGRYSYVVPANALPPFVVSAALDDLAYYTPVAARGTATANVTKLTNLVAVALSPTGDASALAAQVAAGTATVTPDAVTKAVGDLMAALQPLEQNIGDSTNPITGTFKADGTGHDRLLEALSVVVNPAGNGANVVVTVRSVVANGDQAPSISYASGSTPPVLPAAVAKASLPPANMDTRVNALMAQLTRCYGLPLAQRANGSTIIGADCLALFPANDPSRYRFNGATVGPNGAFSGIFSANGNGIVFDRGQLEFTGADGLMIVSYRARSPSGTTSFGTLVVRLDGDVLRINGNQYQYGFVVSPWAEDREFINSPDASYLNTGFNLNMGNAQVNGQSAFDHVLVTSPTGVTYTFKPRSGLSYLAVQLPDGSLSNTSVVRMAGRFNAASTTGAPRTRDTGIYWSPAPGGADRDWTNAELAAVNNIGTWKAEFFLAGNTSGKADVVQYATTLARAATLPELAQKKFAQFTDAYKSELLAASSALSHIVLNAGASIRVGTAAGGDGWMVPAGAVDPTQVQAFGRMSESSSSRWNDFLGVSQGTRAATITCSRQSSGDAHCDANGGYAAGTVFDQLQLSANDMRQENRIKSMQMFKR